MASRLLSFFGLLWISGLQGSPSIQPLLAELEEKSASEGLVIAGVMNRDLLVFPFSGSPFVRRFFDYDLGAVRTSSDGKAPLGYSYVENPGIPARRLALITTAGGVIALLNRDVINIADLAIASDRTVVAFAGKDSGTGEVGIFLGRFGTSDTHLIVPLQSHSGVPQTSLGWVPDGSAVMFSRDGNVWIYDLASQKTSVLFRQGTNPSCSPDGQWISYRNSNGYAMVASRRGTEAKRASRGPIYGKSTGLRIRRTILSMRRCLAPPDKSVPVEIVSSFIVLAMVPGLSCKVPIGRTPSSDGSAVLGWSSD